MRKVHRESRPDIPSRDAPEPSQLHQAAVCCLRLSLSCLTRCESKRFAFSSSARRFLVRPLPARLIKKVSIRMPDPGPLGETFLEANVLAIVAALFVNRPAGGYVDSVLTFRTHLFFFAVGMTARDCIRGVLVL